MKNETKTLEEALRESREKRREFLKREMEINKRNRRKEKILTTIIALFIIVTTILLLNFIGNQYMNDCISYGHNQFYCERGM